MKCCLCGKEIETSFNYSYGNNPSPVCTIENARCCNNCNKTIVEPYRILLTMFKEEYEVLKNALERI